MKAMKVLGLVVDFIIVPIGLTGLALATGFWWAGIYEGGGEGGFLVASGLLLVLGILGFQTGYKKYFLASRKIYFYVVFGFPLAVASVGYLFGLLKLAA